MHSVGASKSGREEPTVIDGWQDWLTGRRDPKGWRMALGGQASFLAATRSSDPQEMHHDPRQVHVDLPLYTPAVSLSVYRKCPRWITQFPTISRLPATRRYRSDTCPVFILLTDCIATAKQHGMEYDKTVHQTSPSRKNVWKWNKISLNIRVIFCRNFYPISEMTSV